MLRAIVSHAAAVVFDLRVFDFPGVADPLNKNGWLAWLLRPYREEQL